MAEAEYGGNGDAKDSTETSTYVFLTEQSKVVKVGGFAGVHETYPIEGQFRLTVDFDAGTAWFGQVDANLTDESGLLYERSLGVIFNMSELAGTVADDTTIEFVGKTADGMDSTILLTLTFRDDSAHLSGRTVPPPNSADFFIYELDAVAWKKYGGGTGEPNDPYRIATADDLMLLGENPEDYDRHFILTDDINLDPNLPGCKVFNKAVIAPDTDPTDRWSEFQGTLFGGVFDGNGYKISHLAITGEDYLGLFGQLGSEAKISNLGLEAVEIYGADYYVGGLVGYNSGSIVASYSTGTVSGGQCVGGLVGWNFEGSIAASYNTGMVSGGQCVGGLVGWNVEGSIAASYSTGTVRGGQFVGGLLGWNAEGKINASYSTDKAAGDRSVGGLVGWNTGSIAMSYSTGTATGYVYVGGLVGRNWDSITMSYCAGTVSGGHYVGGLVGNDSGNITSSFWDMEASGRTTSAGGRGKTTAEMQKAGTFLDASWDFVGESENGTDDIWSICEGTNYPSLTWQIPAGDFVCPDGITIDDFLFFIEHWQEDNCDPSNDYCQGTDLDFSGTVDINDLEIFLENWVADVRSD